MGGYDQHLYDEDCSQRATKRVRLDHANDHLGIRHYDSHPDVCLGEYEHLGLSSAEDIPLCSASTTVSIDQVSITTPNVIADSLSTCPISEYRVESENDGNGKDEATTRGPAEQVCFGMLAALPINHFMGKDSDHYGETLPVSLHVDGESVQLFNPAGFSIGVLGPCHSKMIRVLNQDDGLELQAYVVASASNRARSRSKTCNLSEPKMPTLSVIIYSTMSLFESVGKFVSTCAEYLQAPVHCNRNVPYRNPQSLSGKDDNPPMTLRLQDEHTALKVEIVESGSDPSVFLEDDRALSETEPTSAVQSSLYSHQKQALSFMLQREQGWDFYSEEDDIWKAIKNEVGEVTAYYNTVTGSVSARSPSPFRGGILADSMGLGKSLSVISLLASDWIGRPRCEQPRDPVGPSLIIVPLSLLRTWEDELSLHLQPGTMNWWRYHRNGCSATVDKIFEHDVILTTYDTVVSQWRNIESYIRPLFGIRWRRIILDEAHEIRDSTTVRAKAICALKGEARWAVSGTPIQNRLDDLASLVHFLRVYPDHDIKALKALLRPSSAKTKIKNMLASICLRRSRKVISLPERIDKVHTVRFDIDEATTYNTVNSIVSDHLRQAAAQISHSGVYTNILAKINSLRQICNLGTLYQKDQMTSSDKADPQSFETQQLFDDMLSSGVAMCSKCSRDLSLPDENSNCNQSAYDDTKPSEPRLFTCGYLLCTSCSPASHVLSTPNMCSCPPQSDPCKSFLVSLFSSTTTISPPTKLPTKMRALQSDLLSVPKDDKSIIFSSWTSTLDLIELALKDLSLPCTRVDGTMPLKQRQQSITSFLQDSHIRIILISLRCGSNGLNLTKANHVFLMEPQWNPMLEDQALDRVYRIGQTKEVTTVRYVVEGTLESSIRHQQSQKRHLAEQAFVLSRRHKNWIEQVQALLSGGR